MDSQGDPGSLRPLEAADCSGHTGLGLSLASCSRHLPQACIGGCWLFLRGSAQLMFRDNLGQGQLYTEVEKYNEVGRALREPHPHPQLL